MSASSIPVVQTGDQNTRMAHQRVKERLDVIAGLTKNTLPLDPLPTTASLADVITRLNEILERMQR